MTLLADDEKLTSCSVVESNLRILSEGKNAIKATDSNRIEFKFRGKQQQQKILP